MEWARVPISTSVQMCRIDTGVIYTSSASLSHTHSYTHIVYIHRHIRVHIRVRIHVHIHVRHLLRRRFALAKSS